MPDKERLDIWLVTNGLAESRDKAKAMIISGHVLVNGQIHTKPSQVVSSDKVISVSNPKERSVSRGQQKLEKAFSAFDFKLDGYCGADIGASTGGFTNCLLLHGARKVYAIDVGYGQIDWALRQDSRVIVMERTNARNLRREMFEESLQFATIDVSFISVTKIIPALEDCLEKNAQIITLIKPQFEAGRDKVGKHGVVRDASVHETVIQGLCRFFAGRGDAILGITYSPVKGPKGNIEFLLHTEAAGMPPYALNDAILSDIAAIVSAAADELS
jgi:23S rRNA (cytidine1920-2'-O)/16S rRNA (cytidine1409-2'-O)-methyltransferase